MHKRDTIARILEDKSVAGLTATDVAAVVDEVGLEDAGEIVALLSPAQLAGALDHDLWRAPDSGVEERFDHARFGLWLEILLEMGTAAAAERLLSLERDDEGVVTLGLSRLFHVFAADAIAREVRDADEDDGAQIEKLLESSSILEIDGWFLVARQTAHIDAAHAVIAELDQNHREDLDRILARIAALTDDAAADAGGLFALLSADDQLESDVAGARLDRREAAGFVSPADARAFLALCDAGGDVESIARPYLGPPVTRTRGGELAFLANVLVAHDKRTAPADAAREALACVMRGMARQLSSSSAAPTGAPVMRSFALGWRRRR